MIVTRLLATDHLFRAPDKVHACIHMMHIYSPNPMFDHLLGYSYRDVSNKRSNIGLGEDIT